MDVVNTPLRLFWQAIADPSLADETRRMFRCIADSPNGLMINRAYVSEHVLGFETSKLIPFRSQHSRTHPDDRAARALSSRKTGLFEWVCYYGRHRIGNQFCPEFTARTPMDVVTLWFRDRHLFDITLVISNEDLACAFALTWLMVRIQFELQVYARSGRIARCSPAEVVRARNGNWLPRSESWLNVTKLLLWSRSEEVQLTPENSSYELVTPPETLSEETRHMPQSLTKRQILSE